MAVRAQGRHALLRCDGGGDLRRRSSVGRVGRRVAFGFAANHRQGLRPNDEMTNSVPRLSPSPRPTRSDPKPWSGPAALRPICDPSASIFASRDQPTPTPLRRDRGSLRQRTKAGAARGGGWARVPSCRSTARVRRWAKKTPSPAGTSHMTMQQVPARRSTVKSPPIARRIRPSPFPDAPDIRSGRCCAAAGTASSAGTHRQRSASTGRSCSRRGPSIRRCSTRCPCDRSCRRRCTIRRRSRHRCPHCSRQGNNRPQARTWARHR